MSKIIQFIIVMALVSMAVQFFILMKNIDRLMAIESEQRDGIWCIHDSTAAGRNVCQ